MNRGPHRLPSEVGPEDGQVDYSSETRSGERRVGATTPTGAPPEPAPGGTASWTITKIASSGAIVLRFVGPTKSWEPPEFLAALTDMLPDKNANIIFDLRELHGHNPETKEPIKKWLLANKRRIGQLTVVVSKRATLTKILTAVISLATGVKMVIRDDLDGLPKKSLQHLGRK